LIGVDISESNIRVAREEQAASFAGKGTSFYAQDYMDFQASPFDLIISDSTLHNIAAPTEALFSKIADDLKPGGHLLATMPYPCAYNHLIWAVRRLLLKVRSSRTDAVIYAASKLLHGRRFDDEMLKERVFYMYLLPKRYGSPAFQNFLHASFGLALIRQSPVPHEGLGQPKHRLYVFVKKREPHKDAAT
jgi:SAM-dependent methyltransferase